MLLKAKVLQLHSTFVKGSEKWSEIPKKAKKAKKECGRRGDFPSSSSDVNQVTNGYTISDTGEDRMRRR